KRNALLGFVTTTLILLTIVLAAAQDTTGSEIYGLISVDRAEVRVGPDFAFDSIGQLPLNTSVRVLGRSGDFFRSWDGRQWLQIEWGGGQGWIYARLVRTSIPFNSIPPTGRQLPRDNNGRVPEGLDIEGDVCGGWQGTFTRTGDFMNGDTELTVTYPLLQGANIYSVIVIGPDGERRAFDSETDTATIVLNRLPFLQGTYTWRVAPYYTTSSRRSLWQQICLLQTGGTFEKPYTSPFEPTQTPVPRPTRAPTATRAPLTP
ncbi:MAG: SH3 domain-containing protein, partial [Chloroflexota bacterium]